MVLLDGPFHIMALDLDLHVGFVKLSCVMLLMCDLLSSLAYVILHFDSYLNSAPEQHDDGGIPCFGSMSCKSEMLACLFYFLIILHHLSQSFLVLSSSSRAYSSVFPASILHTVRP